VTETTKRVEHYAIIGVGRSQDNPSGLARRRFTAAGRVDESLQRDLQWHPTSAITQWEYGNLPGELVEISEGEARELIERFREKWSGAD
jgi:hypothetical protein